MQDENSGILYSIMNAYLIGTWLVVIGFGYNMKNTTIRIILIIVASVILISSASLIGISITIDVPFLSYKTFTTNSADGALFYITNIAIFDGIAFASFLAEGEINE